jgi:hypothetical protein
MQQVIMDWENIRQNGGKNVQYYTQEFRKRALMLGIPLYMQETLLKNIGGLHSYLRHTIVSTESYTLTAKVQAQCPSIGL